MGEQESRIACRLCVMTFGLRGSELKEKTFATDAELYAHIEEVHHTPVAREGETLEEATERFGREHPELKTCPECVAAGAPWTK